MTSKMVNQIRFTSREYDFFHIAQQAIYTQWLKMNFEED
jgi:hypothetical protein